MFYVFFWDVDVFVESVMINWVICVFIILGMSYYEEFMFENNILC